MTAPNASPEAAASFGAVLDDKLATDVYDTDISSSGAVSTESRRIHGQHKAEELLYALDEAMPAESDTRDVAAHAMRAAGTLEYLCSHLLLPPVPHRQPNAADLAPRAFDSCVFTHWHVFHVY